MPPRSSRPPGRRSGQLGRRRRQCRQWRHTGRRRPRPSRSELAPPGADFCCPGRIIASTTTGAFVVMKASASSTRAAAVRQGPVQAWEQAQGALVFGAVSGSAGLPTLLPAANAPTQLRLEETTDDTSGDTDRNTNAAAPTCAPIPAPASDARNSTDTETLCATGTRDARSGADHAHRRLRLECRTPTRGRDTPVKPPAI